MVSKIVGGGGTSGIVVTKATTAYSGNYPDSTTIEMPVSEMLQYLADGKVVIALGEADAIYDRYDYYLIAYYHEDEIPPLMVIHIGYPRDGSSNYVQASSWAVENDTAILYYD